MLSNDVHQSLHIVHDWPWGEEATVTVHTAGGAWPSQTQVLSSECYLEGGAMTCEDGIVFNAAITIIYTLHGAQMSVTKVMNGVIEDKERGRLNPNLG